jgi:hypothetical protein
MQHRRPPVPRVHSCTDAAHVESQAPPPLQPEELRPVQRANLADCVRTIATLWPRDRAT